MPDSPSTFPLTSNTAIGTYRDGAAQSIIGLTFGAWIFQAMQTRAALRLNEAAAFILDDKCRKERCVFRQRAMRPQQAQNLQQTRVF